MVSSCLHAAVLCSWNALAASFGPVDFNGAECWDLGQTADETSKKVHGARPSFARQQTFIFQGLCMLRAGDADLHHVVMAGELEGIA